MSEPLKPCPFCQSGVRDLRVQCGCWFEFVVICDACTAHGPEADTKQEAIDAWNRRTDPRPLLHLEREADVLCCCGDHLRLTGIDVARAERQREHLYRALSELHRAAAAALNAAEGEGLPEGDDA